MVQIGEAVIYCDSLQREHEAIVTNVFGGREGVYEPSVNVVYTSPDESKTDTYGRQLERDTSVMHRSSQQAPGRWWKQKEAK